MQRKWKRLDNCFKKLEKYTGEAKLKDVIKLQVGGKWIEDSNEILEDIVAHSKRQFLKAKG
jgi:hypothetical protein